jgi:hypothetical protein
MGTIWSGSGSLMEMVHLCRMDADVEQPSLVGSVPNPPIGLWVCKGLVDRHTIRHWRHLQKRRAGMGVVPLSRVDRSAHLRDVFGPPGQRPKIKERQYTERPPFRFKPNSFSRWEWHLNWMILHCSLGSRGTCRLAYLKV